MLNNFKSYIEFCPYFLNIYVSYIFPNSLVFNFQRVIFSFIKVIRLLGGCEINFFSVYYEALSNFKKYSMYGHLFISK